jgi:cell filamentation protein
LEARSTTERIAELAAEPVRGRLDVKHLRAIHRYIFQDIFAWAGEFRTLNISKGGNLFAHAPFIESELHRILGQLAGEKHLTGLTPSRFAERAAYYLGEINAIHPFREGNGRTQREFIRELGLKAGYEVDWSITTREEMIEASRVSHSTGRSDLFAKLLLDAIQKLV